jgi:hypothetical protein
MSMSVNCDNKTEYSADQSGLLQMLLINFALFQSFLAAVTKLIA